MNEIKPIPGSIAQALDTDYFHWLCHRVLGTKLRDAPWDTLDILYSATFYPIIKMDENRAEDAKALRKVYLDDTNTSFMDGQIPIHVLNVFTNKACNVLELMISVASRMAFEAQIDDLTDDDSMRVHFWDIYSNLLHDNDVNSIEFILNRFITRKYDKNGFGGLFPLHKNTKNQQKVEIWYQMMDYLNERYPLI